MASLLAAAAFVSAAAAPASAASCPPPPGNLYPFTPWGDWNPYVPVTGGSFEPAAPSWSLGGGATIVQDRAPNRLDPATDSRALSLPAGASAVSGCTTAPGIIGVLRFFVKNTGVSTGRLKVEVLVKDGVYQAGSISAGSSWWPSPILDSGAPPYKGAVAYQVRLTAVGAGAAFRVDDVYFDPYKGY